MDNVFRTYWQSPLGMMELKGTEHYISSLLFVEEEGEGSPELPDLYMRCIQELTEYFRGERTEFDIPVVQKGSAFEMMVWDCLRRIPYAETNTYQYLSGLVGNPRATRAVGNACGKNKVLILVPCHRIVGINTLGGYAGGLFRKEYLINLEARQPVQPILF